MIRKLPSGKYRLYSQAKNPKTGKRRDLGHLRHARLMGMVLADARCEGGSLVVVYSGGGVRS